MERLAEHDEIGLLGGRERRWTQNTEVRGLFHRLCLGGAGSPEATQSKDEEEHTALSVILCGRLEADRRGYRHAKVRSRGLARAPSPSRERQQRHPQPHEDGPAPPDTTDMLV